MRRYVLVLVAALLAAAVGVGVGPGDGLIDRKNKDGKVCKPVGSAKSAEAKKLNKLKNRHQPPAEDDIDDDVSMASLLTPGFDDDRFDPQTAATLVAFVVDVKVGGVETCNCKATDPDDRDTHIDLALSHAAPGRQRVVAEVTPRVRDIMKTQGKDWRTQTLKSHPSKKIKGKWVQVTGWLFFDTMHVDEAENTNPGAARNWRATAWELHPVTAIKVLAGPPDDVPELAPATLAAFHAARVRQMDRNPARKDEYAAKRKALLSVFDPEDLDEDLR